MKKTARTAASLMLSLGLVAAACGSDDPEAVADDAVEAADDAVEETEDAMEEAADDAMEEADDAMEESEDAMEEAADDAMEEADDAMEESEDAMEEAADDAMEEDDAMAESEFATVVDVALSSNDFSTLVAALTEADLVGTLQGDGPFTVFAPTNAAFEQALTDLGITAEELLARDDLASILTYHVVPGRILAADAIAADGTEIATVQGDTVAISVVDGSVMVNGATVTSADMEAGNGVVHAIDAVLLPGS